jgi:hypothetical protein
MNVGENFKFYQYIFVVERWRYMTLEAYDLILTGSPAGVGPIKHGDTICAGIDNLTQIQFEVQWIIFKIHSKGFSLTLSLVFVMLTYFYTKLNFYNCY